MNEETKTILKYIRDATNVNKKYFAEQGRRRNERYKSSRQKAKDEFYGNKNINYCKYVGLLFLIQLSSLWWYDYCYWRIG